MRLQTPEKIRDLQRKLYLKAKTEPIGEFACREMKMIGKPYAGELQVRFDEGEQDFVPWTVLNGHEVGNDRYGQGLPYRMLRLFSTLPVARLLQGACMPSEDWPESWGTPERNGATIELLTLNR